MVFTNNSFFVLSGTFLYWFNEINFFFSIGWTTQKALKSKLKVSVLSVCSWDIVFNMQEAQPVEMGGGGSVLWRGEGGKWQKPCMVLLIM